MGKNELKRSYKLEALANVWDLGFLDDLLARVRNDENLSGRAKTELKTFIGREIDKTIEAKSDHNFRLIEMEVFEQR